MGRHEERHQRRKAQSRRKRVVETLAGLEFDDGVF